MESALTHTHEIANTLATLQSKPIALDSFVLLVSVSVLFFFFICMLDVFFFGLSCSFSRAHSNVVAVAVDRPLKCAYVRACVEDHANSILVSFAGLLGSLASSIEKRWLV